MTPKLFDKYIESYNNKERAVDAHNYRLGQYVGIAHRDFSQYPKQPFLSLVQEQEAKEMSDIQMKDEGKRIAIMFGGEIK